MVLKIDSPLFGASARGSVRGVGTFRTTAAGTFLVTNARGNAVPVSITAGLRVCFSTAKAAHSAINPSWQKIAGRWRLRRNPAWPVFWTNWLATHPGCVPRHASLVTLISGWVLAATALRAKTAALASTNIAAFEFVGALIKVHEIYLDTELLDSFSVTATAVRA